MRHPQTKVYLQSCQQSAAFRRCFSCSRHNDRRPFADADRKEYPEKEIALGKTTKEIAAEKNLSFHTINSHRKNIFRKLGVNNVHEATKYAMRAGIVDLAEYYI